MNKVMVVALLIGVGVVGYTLGLSHSHDRQQHPERAVKIESHQPKSGKLALSSAKNSQSGGQYLDPITGNSAADESDTSEAVTDTGNNEQRSLETIMAMNPVFFRGKYSDIARMDGKYPRAIKKFSNENGISSWGVQREQDAAKLFTTDQLKSIDVKDVQCRIETCVIRGTAPSKKEAYRVFENYQNVQQWGVHFGGHENESGQYVFYLASFRQTN